MSAEAQLLEMFVSAYLGDLREKANDNPHLLSAEDLAFINRPQEIHERQILAMIKAGVCRPVVIETDGKITNIDLEFHEDI